MTAAPSWAQERVRDVHALVRYMDAVEKLHVIDASKGGHPVHPLMQPYAKGLRRWEVANADPT